MDCDPRDHDSRERGRGDGHDPRDAFMRDLDLPRGADREIVRDRDHEYSLRASETRTLSIVGAFRVVPASKLRDHSCAPADPRSGDLRNLREQGLVETVRIPGRRDHAVVLTKRGRELLQRHRGHDQNDRHTFYAGLTRSRELEHDSQVYDAYLHVAGRLENQGARIDRVVLETISRILIRLIVHSWWRRAWGPGLPPRAGGRSRGTWPGCTAFAPRCRPRRSLPASSSPRRRRRRPRQPRDRA